jgi:hypothetical protein
MSPLLWTPVPKGLLPSLETNYLYAVAGERKSNEGAEEEKSCEVHQPRASSGEFRNRKSVLYVGVCHATEALFLSPVVFLLNVFQGRFPRC